jgi:hypothetical protein
MRMVSNQKSGMFGTVACGYGTKNWGSNSFSLQKLWQVSFQTLLFSTI